MSLIERRWTITFDSEGRPRDVGEHADARALHNGWTTVEVIPAADARGAVDRIKALKDRVRPDDPDEREAAYGRGYQAAVTDALETLVGGQ
jgi:hypothetical protein